LDEEVKMSPMSWRVKLAVVGNEVISLA